MEQFFNFERYTPAAIGFGWSFIILSIIFVILIREAKNEQSNWSAPLWFANIVIFVFSMSAGAIVVRMIEVWTGFFLTPVLWNIIPIGIIGWISTFFLHAIIKKLIPNTLKKIALALFS